VRDKSAPHHLSVAPGVLDADARGPTRWTVAVTRAFPGRPDQVSRAREFVRQVLGPVPVADEAVLLVSELCTNALLHTGSGAGGSFEVAVYRRSFWLRVEVRDDGSGQLPVARQPADSLVEDGRGLGLVELVAERWGHSGDRRGRSVFFELRWKPLD
jgi:anti-sigma regulatory factor (Ser/Thr protein kinase)